MVTDSDLLRRYAVDGSEDAFREIVERRFGLVYAIALRQVGGDAHLARDVAQQVFATLAQQAATLARRPVISGWLYRTARFTAIDVVRAEQRRRRREAEAQLIPDPMNVEADADWTSIRPTLDAALSALNDRDRDVVTLRLLEERSFAEIGCALQVSEDAARMRFERAVGRLRQQLRRRGITSTAAGLMVAVSHQAIAVVPVGLPTLIAGSALASAKVAVGTGVIAGMTLSMSATKAVQMLSSAVVLIALGLGLHQAGEARFQRKAAVALQDHIDLLKFRAAHFSSGESPTAVSRPPQPAVPSALTAASAPDAPVQDEVERIRAAYEANQGLLADNVAYQELWLRAAKVSIRLDYASLYPQLKLTPPEIEALEDLLAQQEAAAMDITAAVRQLGLDPGGPVVRELRRREEERFQSALRSLVGDEAYAQLQEWRTRLPARALVSQVAGAVYHTDTPLTPEQAVSLTELIVRHHPSLREPGHEWRKDAIDWDAIAAETSVILAPAQVAAWLDVSVQERWAVELIRRLNTRRASYDQAKN